MVELIRQDLGLFDYLVDFFIGFTEFRNKDLQLLVKSFMHATHVMIAIDQVDSILRIFHLKLDVVLAIHL